MPRPRVVLALWLLSSLANGLVPRQAPVRSTAAPVRSAAAPPLRALQRLGGFAERAADDADDEAEDTADARQRRKRRYINLTGFPFPLAPLFERRTVRREVGRGIWSFEQEQGLFGINANVRMVVVRLDDGSLWVHNPVAPTDECIELLRELDAPVKYVVLGSTQYEHKIFVAPFSRRVPEADVYIVPDQWSFPIDLPPALLGIFATGLVASDAAAGAAAPAGGGARMPWADEIETTLLRPPTRLGLGYAAVEAAFVHKRSKTLVCTDALVHVPATPPAVLSRDSLRWLGGRSNAVLELARLTNWRGGGAAIAAATAADDAAAAARGGGGGDDTAAIARGWRRNALLALYFGPSGESIAEPSAAFDAIAGRWIVGPVCYRLIYDSDAVRPAVGEWIETLCARGGFEKILPSHFDGPVRGTPRDVRRAFAFALDARHGGSGGGAAARSPLAALAALGEQLGGAGGVGAAARLSKQRGGAGGEGEYPSGDLQLLTDLAALCKRFGVI